MGSLIVTKQMKLCVDLNTDDNKCGVPLNRFAHNQMFGNHQSILTDRARTSSFALHRHRPSKA